MEQLCTKIPSYRFPSKAKRQFRVRSRWKSTIRNDQKEGKKTRTKRVWKFSIRYIRVVKFLTTTRSNFTPWNKSTGFIIPRTYFFTKRIHEAGDKIKIERKIPVSIFPPLIFLSIRRRGKKIFSLSLPSFVPVKSQFHGGGSLIAARQLYDREVSINRNNGHSFEISTRVVRYY